MEEGGALADAGGLLHGVGDDHDRIAAREVRDQLLDLGGGDRVERRTGFVHQDDFGIDRDGARDAQALLLAARQRGPAIGEAILDFFPKAGAPQGFLDDRVELVLAFGKAMDFRTVGDVFVDRFGERVGLLEHHPDPRAQLHHVELGIVDVLPIQRDLAFHARGGDGVVHPVEAAQKGRFAATRRADKGRHVFLRNVDRYGIDRLLRPIEHVHVMRAHLGFGVFKVVVNYGHQRFSNLLRR